MITCCYCSQKIEVKSTSTTAPFLAACASCMNPMVVRFDNGSWRTNAPHLWQDIRQSAREESIGGQVLRECWDAREQLPVLPAIAHRITELVRDPNSVIGDISALIQSDPVIAMRILRVANSALYAGLSEIKDLHAACVRLGMKTVAGIVHAIGNGRLYVTKDPAFQNMMHSLWRHALATAYCAGELAVMLAQPQKDVFFVAGLIHDIGKVVLLDVVSNILPRKESPAIESLRQSSELLAEVMEAYHPLIGLHIVQYWNLPVDFGIVAFCHEHGESLPSEEWALLNHTVSLSSAIATCSGYGLASQTEDVSLLSLPSTKFLGLTDIKLASLRVRLEDNVAALLDASSAA